MSAAAILNSVRLAVPYLTEQSEAQKVANVMQLKIGV
jgi:hypothetical protein